MYDVTVPLIGITAEKMGLENHLKELRRLDAKRVMISMDKIFLSEDKKAEVMAALTACCDFFHKNGLEVGVWIWSFWLSEPNRFARITGEDGRESESFVCPSDAKFREIAGAYLEALAGCGVDMIQFDDDFRYGNLGVGNACFCENHLWETNRILGENLTCQELADRVLNGGKSKYRSAWLKAKGASFEQFAKEMREAADRVNPKIRICLCSCISTWDMDGISAARISRILAGNTRPILRTIGAPYWAVKQNGGNRLQDVIELTRMERSWCEEDIEVISEGDVYPRPRTRCPGSYLEIFDTALRADGSLDGILKYGIDYHSNPGYEEGYLVRHEKNRELYREIEEMFSDKTCCGVRVYERLKKFEEMQIPDPFQGWTGIHDFGYSPAARMLTNNSISTIYDGEGVCGIAFAENVTMASSETMKKGLIIDLRAAEILQEQGVDVGLVSVGGQYSADLEEYDLFQNQYLIQNDVPEIQVKETAEILSHFVAHDGLGREQKRSVGSYYYKNQDGQQFLVFALYSYAMIRTEEGWYRSYLRSAELNWAVQRFGGALPAYSYGNPDLYFLTKKNERSMAVGAWNIFPDEIFEPVITLDQVYSKIRFIHCEGRMEGNRVFLSRMEPMAFAAFEVEE